SPRSSVESPVPPPRATTRKPGERAFDLEARFFIRIFGIAEAASFHGKESNTARRSRNQKQMTHTSEGIATDDNIFARRTTNLRISSTGHFRLSGQVGNGPAQHVSGGTDIPVCPFPFETNCGPARTRHWCILRSVAVRYEPRSPGQDPQILRANCMADRFTIGIDEEFQINARSACESSAH